MEEDETNSGSILAEHQLKYCSQVLTRIKRNSNAPPFLEPVDPVKLGIPDYPEKIKHPMDLSTIRKKLDAKEYSGPEGFDSDMKLMFNNCYTYNPPGTVVHDMGKALESVYNDMMEGMPQEVSKKRKKTEVPAVVRPKQVKRSIKPIEVMKTEDYEFCSEVLNDLVRPKHKAYNWPFLEPVDGDLVPGYYSVIKEPMDMQTMRNKLEQRKYHSVEEFGRDLELIVENCKKFNAPGTEVYACGQEFERAIKAHMEKTLPADIKSRISELKRKVVSYTREIRMLESKLMEQTGEAPSSRAYSLSERVSIGNAILNMTKEQTENVAKIVLKNGAGEFVENDEIEVDMRTIPDHVVEEIDMYIKSINVGEDVRDE
ncbi:chromatin remodeling bromodomain-containing transcription factor [Encephalitozoon hellem ATCC 50504]|uniref:Bromodomain-like protein n=1 Tax=Encephalitozoon hellem TaxID=27973 RepID=A0A9Q9C464_ENCHE|nr:chromatin remodeling bromodomain-containing transcription factor [Encephalitozoon hellem ATCC 50504]AFM98861.1 chromatin remodeling bromodomain-containing transcription factor [Encephalitozoon hellem ATCC 50504]UTX43841.1 transcription initiation factor tfiid subunit 1 [Encephalitozoon hellem]WEL39319.1 bromodomain-like protein [Encephalitozoon hellem]|eukprot:XP_003887842.1 chromatin remodeling bromodomain-containing transcription factor [Encephalitozoon hellem ATCC 50504]